MNQPSIDPGSERRTAADDAAPPSRPQAGDSNPNDRLTDAEDELRDGPAPLGDDPGEARQTHRDGR